MKGPRLTWYQMLVEMIDLRSFSNLWYWIALAVIWSSASYWVLGVPYDMVTRARRQGGQVQQDLETLVRINTSRMLFHSRERGPWLVGVICFLLTVLLLMGFVYKVEFAQAVLLLFVPLCGLGYLSLRSAMKVEAGESSGEALFRRLMYHRLSVQFLGMMAIFVTAMYGMYVDSQLIMPR